MLLCVQLNLTFKLLKIKIGNENCDIMCKVITPIKMGITDSHHISCIDFMSYTYKAYISGLFVLGRYIKPRFLGYV